MHVAEQVREWWLFWVAYYFNAGVKYFSATGKNPYLLLILKLRHCTDSLQVYKKLTCSLSLVLGSHCCHLWSLFPALLFFSLSFRCCPCILALLADSSPLVTLLRFKPGLSELKILLVCLWVFKAKVLSWACPVGGWWLGIHSSLGEVLFSSQPCQCLISRGFKVRFGFQ